MKKRSMFMAMCAILGVFSSAVVGCGSEKKEDSMPETSINSEVQNSETPETSETSEIPDAPSVSEEPETPENPDEPQESRLTISAPAGTVYPYLDAAKEFLQAGEGADVADYYVKGLKNPQVPVSVKFKFDAEGAKKFVIEYATKADYSDAISVEIGAAKRSVDLYNLYKGVNYHLRIKAVDSKGNVIDQSETEFKTTDLGPRVMNVEGAYNVRDLGGFDTCFGKKLVQGIAYRGGMLHYNETGNNGDLTAAGKKTLSEELGVKAELDFRSERESWVTMEQGSSIPGATLTYITAGGYEDIFSGTAGSGAKEVYRKIFAYLADTNNYPLYYHCTAGADRTGTVSYILHAFLGVSELECHQDFAFTSFSVYGMRASQSGAGDNSERYMNMVRLLQEYEGNNLQEKAQNYLLSIGVTETELESIKAIFFGEVEIPGAKTYNPNETIEGEETLSIMELGEVSPYIDSVKNYLEAGEGAKVSDYHSSVANQVAPVQIRWQYNAKNASKFLVEYATKSDYSDAIIVETDAAKRFINVYNLYKGTKYFIRVTALNANGETLHEAESEMQTTDLGPRFMYVDDVRNVRDLGGYVTADGKTLAQGIAYRGGALTPPPNSQHYFNTISEEGKAYMSEVMGIKTEIDFRTAGESGITLEQGSVIPGAELTYITLNGYESTFGYTKEYKEFFTMLADKNNYPMYMHCTGGADRTGSVVYLLHTLLGISELECIQGYELTSFSIYGERDTQSGTYKDYFDGFMAKLNTYEGATKQEKVTNWVLSLGITQEQINTIKGIFYGEIAIGESNATPVKAKAYASREAETTTVEVGTAKIHSNHLTNPKAVYFQPISTDVTLPIDSWNDEFSYVSGNGITINGEMINMNNTVKSIGKSGLYVGLGLTAKTGDVLKIGGVLRCEAQNTEYVIEDSAFIWNGTQWETYADVDYETHNLGKLSFNKTTASNGSNPIENAYAYFARKDNEKIPKPNDGNNGWTAKFAWKNGVGITINDVAVTATVKVPGDIFIAFTSAPNVGDILKIGGTFYNEEYAVQYIIEESVFKWNGVAWLEYAAEGGEEAYKTHTLGALAVHRNSDGSSSNTPLATQLYMKIANGMDIPYPDSGWDTEFILESGEGWKLNGTTIVLGQLESTNSGLFINLATAGVQVGDTLTVEGTFVSTDVNAKYVIAKSAFTWNGTKWENYVNYDSYELGKLAFDKTTQTNDQTPIPNGYVYLKTEGGASMQKPNDGNGGWTAKFAWKKGVGITINDVAVTATVKFPDGRMFIAFKQEPQLGDVLKIGGTFYNEELELQYVIEESVFEWDGNAWIACKDYTVYEVGKLSVSGTQTSASSIVLTRANGENFAAQNTFNYFGGSGVGILLNGEALSVNTAQISATTFTLNLGVTAKEGDVLRIGGVFYHVNTSVKYEISESAFIYEQGAWKAYESAYTEIGVGEVGVLDDASSERYVYFKPVNSSLTFDLDSWDDAFVATFGAGVQFNGFERPGAKIRSIDSTIYVAFGRSAVKGDVLTIGGKFVCESQGVLYYVKECTFVWNGEAWISAGHASLSEYKAYAQSAIATYYEDDCTEEQFNAISAIIVKAQSDINACTSFTELGKIVHLARQAIDDVVAIPIPEPEESEEPDVPVTSEPEESEEPDVPVTSEPESEGKKGGCGATIGLTVSATLAAAAAAVVLKKKED